MEKLVSMVSEKTGISEDQARQAVTMVVGFIKERLPDPIAAKVDGLLEGDGGGLDVSDLGGVGNLAKGLFGKK